MHFGKKNKGCSLISMDLINLCPCYFSVSDQEKEIQINELHME